MSAFSTLSFFSCAHHRCRPGLVLCFLACQWTVWAFLSHCCCHCRLYLVYTSPCYQHAVPEEREEDLDELQAELELVSKECAMSLHCTPKHQPSIGEVNMTKDARAQTTVVPFRFHLGWHLKSCLLFNVVVRWFSESPPGRIWHVTQHRRQSQQVQH